MKKGISYFFGYNEKPETRIQLIKNAGFDNVITSADPAFDLQNGSIEMQIKLISKYGLKISSLHNQYRTNELVNFWLDNEIGDKLEKTLMKDISIANKYSIKYVVVHMIGKYSQFGEKRLLRVLNFCKQNNVYLAVENIDHQKILVDIFNNINHQNLKFCYDSGHNNCFDPNFDYLEKYGEKLVCLHLHSNDGLADQHNLNRFGTINWELLAKKLAKINNDDISLDYEMLPKDKHGIEMNEFIAEVYKQACELEEMILNYKKEC